MVLWLRYKVGTKEVIFLFALVEITFLLYLSVFPTKSGINKLHLLYLGMLKFVKTF